MSNGESERVADVMVRDWVREDFGIELVSLDEVHHGADYSAQLWHGRGEDGTRYAVKLSGGGSAAGLLIPAYLAQQDIAGIAGPLPARDGEWYSVREGRRLSLVPWVADERAIEHGLTAAQWTSFGRLLSQVHSAQMPSEVLAPETYSNDRVVSLVRAVDQGIESASDDLTRELAREWRAHREAIGALVSRVDSNGRELRACPPENVVCHADPHLGNVLLGQSERVWLIDWDDAMLSPRERDLMLVLAFEPIPITAQEERWFLAGYGPVDIDPALLAYFRSLRTLEDLDFALLVLDPGRGEAERTLALSRVRKVLSRELGLR